MYIEVAAENTVVWENCFSWSTIICFSFKIVFNGALIVGTAREDVLNLLIPAVEGADQADLLAVASLACGLVAIGTSNASVSNAILTKLVDARDTEALKSSQMRMAVLGNIFFCTCNNINWNENTKMNWFKILCVPK